MDRHGMRSTVPLEESAVVETGARRESGSLRTSLDRLAQSGRFCIDFVQQHLARQLGRWCFGLERPKHRFDERRGRFHGTLDERNRNVPEFETVLLEDILIDLRRSRQHPGGEAWKLLQGQVVAQHGPGRPPVFGLLDAVDQLPDDRLVDEPQVVQPACGPPADRRVAVRQQRSHERHRPRLAGVLGVKLFRRGDSNNARERTILQTGQQCTPALIRPPADLRPAPDLVLGRHDLDQRHQHRRAQQLRPDLRHGAPQDDPRAKLPPPGLRRLAAPGERSGDRLVPRLGLEQHRRGDASFAVVAVHEQPPQQGLGRRLLSQHLLHRLPSPRFVQGRHVAKRIDQEREEGVALDRHRHQDVLQQVAAERAVRQQSADRLERRPRGLRQVPQDRLVPIVTTFGQNKNHAAGHKRPQRQQNNALVGV